MHLMQCELFAVGNINKIFCLMIFSRKFNFHCVTVCKVSSLVLFEVELMSEPWQLGFAARRPPSTVGSNTNYADDDDYLDYDEDRDFDRE